MKNFKSLLLIILIIAISATALVSCAAGKNSDKNKNENDDQKTASTYDISSFRIIRPYSASGEVITLTSAIKKTIVSKTGADLPVGIDIDFTESGSEILVGNTDRPESQALLDEVKSKTSKEAFAIKVLENKIVIVGISNDDTLIAVNYFIDEIVSNADDGKKALSLENGDVIMKKTGKVFYKSQDLLTIFVEEERSDAYIPPDPSYNEACTFGKIIKLEHQPDEKNNGILIASKENNAYESKAKDLKYPILRSTDDGKTWKEIHRLVDHVNPGSTLGYQPYLFELPEDIGSFKKGTILFASCTRTPATTMVIQYSTDLGESWKGLCNVEQGGLYNQGGWSSEGLWEPVLQYENGRLYCFYSDELENGEGENHVGGHNQRLVYRYTTDMKTWSDKKEMVALEEPDARPGMIALTKMGNGKWALAYEGCGMGYNSCAIHIKFADTLDSWDAADRGTLIKNPAGSTMGSSPAIAWTPAGGECGTLFVTASYSTNSKTKCDLFLSFDYGKTFVSINNPINLSFKGDHKLYGGYSPGMYVDKEGKLYYVNNPQYTVLWQEKLEFLRVKVY